VNGGAETREDVDVVINLRSDTYQEQRIVAPTSDPFDWAPNSTSFVLLEQQMPLATIRVSIRDEKKGWLGTSLSDLYPDALGHHVGSATFIELGRLCALRQSHSRSSHLLALFQNGTAEADQHDCAFMVANVRADHLPFYLAMGFIAASEPRVFAFSPYSLVLVILNWRTQRDVMRRHKTYGRMFTERNN
jgi:hypothetical protein